MTSASRSCGVTLSCGATLAEARALGVVGILLVLGSALAACGLERGHPISVAPSAALATDGASDRPSAPLVVDPRLLAILPERVAGVAISASPDTANGMISDPLLQASASAIVVGAAIDPAGLDLAIASVIQLRPGVYTATFFEGWRAAYDAAACARAGGVSSHVSQVLGARRVDVAVCTQGARTYHVHLAGDIIVSITAAGDRMFGNLVMAGLRE